LINYCFKKKQLRDLVENILDGGEKCRLASIGRPIVGTVIRGTTMTKRRAELIASAVPCGYHPEKAVSVVGVLCL
jgi:hypothetical protein